MVEVKCSYSELRDIDTLVPNPKNPNKHPDKQIELLAKIIKHQGIRQPVVVSKRSGFIVKGHGRVEALKLLSEELGLVSEALKVPVDLQDYQDEAMEWADMVADNKIAELSHTDKDELSELLKNLPNEFDLELFGDFDLKVPEPGDIDLSMHDTDKVNYNVTIKCDDEVEQADLRRRFAIENNQVSYKKVVELFKGKLEQL